MTDFKENPSSYEGRLIEENRQLKDHLYWCLEMLENFPMDIPHSGPCSPPATPCDGACMDAYYFYQTLNEIRKIFR
jgi:hypothetical protein